ncbi:MAG: NfeD family protein [Clostridiales Family XIII bacterium]|jgi:membrane protein implicated in regulation of membrane protease activity|nr:NfeD family protein [Clostridiales Family XIII bacterium]
MDGLIGTIWRFMPVVWVVAAVVLALVEAMTMGLTTIWFAIGAVAAAAAAWLGGGFLVQIAVFLAVSAAMLYFTRPVAVRKLNVGREKNAMEQMEGRPGVVTEGIDPFGAGLVKVGGVIWTAICESPDIGLEAGRRVNVVRVEGVKIIVRPADSAGGLE